MVSIPIKPRCDANNMFGRACPACGRYFRMKLGTGLPDQSECHCPYCRHTASHTKFWVRKQFNTIPASPESGSGEEQILVPVFVRGRAEPVKEFPEKDLEVSVRCSECSLEYAVFGSFAHCPDCGVSNTREILAASFSATGRLLKLAGNEPTGIRDLLIESALDDAVSSFDGFSRARCPGADRNLSFLDIQEARDALYDASKFDLAASISSRDWAFIRNQFQTRHLLAQKGGVIDDTFAKAAGLAAEAVGRKVKVSGEDVARLMATLERIADSYSGLAAS